MEDEFLTTEEAARRLGVSGRHVRRLTDAGTLTRTARGLVDRMSLERYLRSGRQGRTRSWAEHTAWGAVALLSGEDASWLGGVQASRLRSSLRDISEADDLLARLRDRAQVHTFEAHRATLAVLRERTAHTDLRLLGLSDAVDDGVDGYLPQSDLRDLVGTLGLRASARGNVVLRTTGFSFGRVRALVTTPAAAALDAATSIDPRLSGVGHQALGDLLAAFR